MKYLWVVLAALIGFAAPVRAQGVAQSELTAAERWLDAMIVREKRQQTMSRIVVPSLLGATALLAGGAAAIEDTLPRRDRRALGVLAVMGAGLVLPPVLSSDRQRHRWMTASASAMGAAVGGYLLHIGMHQPADCEKPCFADTGGFEVAGATVAVSAIMMASALFEPPAVEVREMQAAKLLPEQERRAATERILARIDDQERVNSRFLIVGGSVATSLYLTGALRVQEPQERLFLGLFASYFLIATVFNIAHLFSATRVERFQHGSRAEMPRGWGRF